MIIDEGKLLHPLYYESGKCSREAPELYRKKHLTSKLLRSLNPGWAKTSPTAGSNDCWGVIQVLDLPVQQNNQLLILDISFCEVWGYQVLIKMRQCFPYNALHSNYAHIVWAPDEHRPGARGRAASIGSNQSSRVGDEQKLLKCIHFLF